MSGLFSSLNATVMALSAHSRAIETSGKNLANVNNPSYARQRVIYGDRGTVVTPDGAEGLGIEALGVQQMRDALLDRQVARESSLTASFTAEQSGYQRAQAALGQSITASSSTSTASSTNSNGIGAALTISSTRSRALPPVRRIQANASPSSKAPPSSPTACSSPTSASRRRKAISARRSPGT